MQIIKKSGKFSQFQQTKKIKKSEMKLNENYF